MEYQPNAGQTYVPFQDNINVGPLPFTPLPKPDPALPELELNQMARDKGYILNAQNHHFLPGVTPEMLDWWWVNMEKGYFLWAPGSHKRFNWVRPPWKYGFLNSAHIIAESLGKGIPVFGGSDIQINRLDLSCYPFTTALEHVICEGVFNDKGEFVDSTIHMWQAAPGGCVHIDASVANPNISEPPSFVKEALAADPNAKPVPSWASDHSEYETSRWPEFLPTLYNLWKGHPDPTQNVFCDLRVRQTGPETWEYLCENGPVQLNENT